jgi:hypothetical protein
MLIPPKTPEERARAEELKVMIDAAQARFEAMSPEEQEAMMKQQREGYARAEMSWPRDCPYR